MIDCSHLNGLNLSNHTSKYNDLLELKKENIHTQFSLKENDNQVCAAYLNT